MDIEFNTKELDRLETDSTFTAGFAREIVKAYRKRIQSARAAQDERDLRAIKGNRFEKLQGDRAHQHSLRLNEKMRLIVEIKKGNSGNILVIMGVENYH
jgi:proteic killer suppression protein